MKQYLNEIVEYYEVQKFKQKILRVLVVVSALFPLFFFLYGIYAQTVLKIPFGSKPLSDNGLLIATATAFLFAVAILYLFFASKLETVITASGLHVRLYPFMKFKTIKFDSIKQYKIRQYKPILEYGGWGIRISHAGRAFNVSGNIGLQLYLKDGSKILIGTSNPDELHSVFSRFCIIKQEQ